MALSCTGRWASTESGWDGDDAKRYCYRVWGTCDTSQRRGDIFNTLIIPVTVHVL